ncbi:acyl-CoA dehydrogenase family protein [Psychrobacillus sp. NPDC096426]|uniref:acyl-CoA dehydrogenase family protein n=1 Tax=Psychrobacillus sp. NPDC096426 TaxID=3364491 RepID=UPI0037FA4511
MSEMKSYIEGTTEKILKVLSTKEQRERFEEGEWNVPLWQAIQEAGLTLLSIDEEKGGVGGDYEDVFAILRIVGKYAAPIPLAEVIYANQFIANHEGEVEPKLRVVHFENGSEEELKYVPFARYADEVIVISTEGYKVVNLALNEISSNKENIAAEPRDTVKVIQRLENRKLNTTSEEALEDYTNFLALSRVAMMAGAMESVLALSIFYSKERQQFGRSLYKFQAIQQHLTVMAGETAAANATLAVTSATYQTDVGKEQIAMAKIELSANANLVAKAAHQLHAGIGMTYEHELHHFTRRLWAWREEGGNETYWADQLATMYLAREETIWESITQVKGAEVHV